jgi:hypothetical protein
VPGSGRLLTGAGARGRGRGGQLGSFERDSGSREGAKPRSPDERRTILATTFLISALRKLLIEW